MHWRTLGGKFPLIPAFIGTGRCPRSNCSTTERPSFYLTYSAAVYELLSTWIPQAKYISDVCLVITTFLWKLTGMKHRPIQQLWFIQFQAAKRLNDHKPLHNRAGEGNTGCQLLALHTIAPNCYDQKWPEGTVPLLTQFPTTGKKDISAPEPALHIYQTSGLLKIS